MDTQTETTGKTCSKKCLGWTIAAVVLAAVAVWAWQAGIFTQSAAENILPGDDTTASINEGLTGIDVGDIDQEFKDIDASVQGL
ncbi:MAG: hypothetical protein V1656_03110 [Candidatus Jorgensenbacteria bacterium]